MYTRIKYLRFQQGWTQDELAKHANLGRNTIITTEAGKIPRMKSLNELAKAFNCSVKDLYTEDKKYADGFFEPGKPEGRRRPAA